MDYHNSTLGEIACAVPGATQVFRQYKLDFCCSGDRTIATAVEGTELTSEEVVEALGEIDGAATSENPALLEPTALIAYILERCHEKHRRDLPELIKLANKVEHVHQERPFCPLGLTGHLVFMMQELELHMQKEERVLFPAIEQGMLGMVAPPIQVMRDEHVEHGRNLEKLTSLVFDFEIPEHACNTWRALILGVKTFTEDITEHIHLENNVLFPNVLSQKEGVA